MQLSLKQKLFVEKYLETRNATAAARDAGYSGDDATLRSIASENLTKPNIRAEIEKRLSSRILSVNQVLAELSEVAFADWREFLEIVTDKTGKTVDVRLRLGDKLKALELVGKYHALFTEKIAIADLDRQFEAEVEQLITSRKANISGEAEGETVH